MWLKDIVRWWLPYGFVVWVYKKRHPFSSKNYWENRYKTGENSGSGSYGRLCAFKAEVINDFLKEKHISSVIEFGVGDGNQLKNLNVEEYIGFDVSSTVIKNNKILYARDKTKSFFLVDDFTDQKAELVLSLDVIFHLVEDSVFEKYMANIFKASTKYVIIYSSNYNGQYCEHVRHRNFTKWVDKKMADWKLIKFVKNRYPWDENDEDHTSFCDFYIYEKNM